MTASSARRRSTALLRMCVERWRGNAWRQIGTRIIHARLDLRGTARTFKRWAKMTTDWYRCRAIVTRTFGALRLWREPPPISPPSSAQQTRRFLTEAVHGRYCDAGELAVAAASS